MKKVLITGASGMLGASLVSTWSNKYNIFATGRSNFPSSAAQNYKIFNLTNDNYSKLREWVKPDIILHCAAIISHEYCQKYPGEAKKVNGESVQKLRETFPDAKLIFISTDAVFPFNTYLAKENTPTGAQTIYGKSKEFGEKYLINFQDKNSCIIRTTIVGKNSNPKKQGFVEWIINSVNKKEQIVLFDDVLFTPISIWDLAYELEWVINNKTPFILHISGKEIVTKFDFGYNLCKNLGLNASYIKKGSLKDANLLVKKSSDQSLDCSYYQSFSGHDLPDLNKTIKTFIHQYEKI